MTPSIAVFGLGIMGRPMARRLVAAGYATCGWNRSRLADELVAGIPLCGDPQTAAQADICLLMLTDAAAVAAVLAQIEDQLQPGQIVLDMSSADPESSVQHAARLAARGIGWVDAPVSGGPEGAAAGTLAIMVGGSEADFARVEPVLQVLGGNVVRVGAAGAGHTVKLVNQLICGLVIQAVAEGLLLAERAGIDPRLVQQALRGGFADSKVLQIHGTRMIERAYVPGGFVSLHLKDLRSAQQLAAKVGLTLPHLDSVTAFYEQLAAQGDARLDQSALHKLLLD